MTGQDAIRQNADEVAVVGFDHDALERLRHDLLPGLGSHVWEPAQVPDIRRRDHDVIRRAAEQRRLGRQDTVGIQGLRVRRRQSASPYLRPNTRRPVASPAW